jgi:hypothetical protein
MSESSSKYDYVNLLQVKQGIGQFNTFGVVTEVKPPRKTKGTGTKKKKKKKKNRFL